MSQRIEQPVAREHPPSLPAVRKLSQSEFHSAMVHLYRGEVGRANTWRMRLDGTTNWAVLTTGATLSFAFSSSSNTHVMILVNSLLVLFFLFIEARRYMFYDLWRRRIRLMETEFFAELLTPMTQEHHDEWRRLLANDLLHPHFGVSLWEALGRRLRRNYIWIFGVLLLSWVVKILLHPSTPNKLDDVLRRIAIGPIPAWLVLLTGVIFNGFLLALLVTTSEHFTEGEAQSGEATRARMRREEDG
jgi:uncharacterized membrane protein